MSETHPRHLVRFAADVAEALEGVTAGGSLDWYVEAVTFGYDGETHRGIRVAPDEFGGYGVVIEDAR